MSFKVYRHWRCFLFFIYPRHRHTTGATLFQSRVLKFSHTIGHNHSESIRSIPHELRVPPGIPQELGAYPEDIFQDMEYNPVAAASLGQVRLYLQ